MTTKSSGAELTRYRWQVASRVLAAVLGGYVLSSLVGVFLSIALPLSRSDAVVTANVLSFAIYTGAVIWVFAVGTLRRAWLGLVVPSAVLGALITLISLN